MSADNSIIILKTPTSNGFEYRVIHTQAIDNIYLNDNGTYEPDGNPQFVVDYFGGSQVFLDEMEAHQQAFNILDKMEAEGDFVEYGVSMIDLPHPFDYYVGKCK